MCPAIDNLASCKIPIIIIFLHSKSMIGAEIHGFCAVYDQNVMIKGTIRQCVECSKIDGRTNVHNVERSGRPAICSER
jgi:hypothetical protein